MAIRRCGPDRRRGRGGRWPRRRLGRDGRRRANSLARPHRRRAVGGERLVCAHRQFRLARFHRAHWPSFPDAAHRGVPDRSKSLGDEGKRVWETFKSDYELFPIGDDVAGARALALDELRWPQSLRRRDRQSGKDDRLVRAVRRFQPAELHGRRPRHSARRRERRLYPLRDPFQRGRVLGLRGERLGSSAEPA